MNKQELINVVAEKAGLSKKDAGAAVDSTIEAIEEALVKKDKIQIIGFGTFETRVRKARKGRNPRKPEEVMDIPASTAPVFKAGKALKDAVNNK